MNIYEMILKCKSDEELRELCNKCIKKADKITKDEYNNAPSKVIGSLIDYNPSFSLYEETPLNSYPYLNCYNGFIPKDVKIVYGTSYHFDYNFFSNEGCYYYSDDYSYIYNFFKYIKNYKIREDYDIVLATFEFIHKNFVYELNKMEREDIHKLIYKESGLYYDVIKEHSITDFYNERCFRCTEISLYTQNLLSVFGIESLYIMDKDHAYNICKINDLENKDLKSYYVIEYSYFVCVYDYNHDLIGKMPYIEKIDNCDDNLLQDFVDGKINFDNHDYYLYEINGVVYKFYTDEIRKYGSFVDKDSLFEPSEKSLILK